MAIFFTNVIVASKHLSTNISTTIMSVLRSYLASNLFSLLSTEARDGHEFLTRNTCTRMALKITP